MPTIEDLRAVLTAREDYAGDPDTVLQHLASPPRRRVLAPTLAAATVAALAVGGVLLAATESDRQQPSGGSGPGSTVPPATTAPPNADATLDWDFSVGAVDGYHFTRFFFDASSQQARITRSSDGSLAGFVTVYSPSVDPKSLQLGANGEHVVVNGTDGMFLPGTTPDTVRAVDHPDSWPRLLWHYRDDAWAEIDGPFDFQSDTHSYDNDAARTTELRIAAATRIGPGGPITMPFAVPLRPSEFAIAAAETGTLACLGYDLADQPQSGSATIGSTLTVCRIASGNVDDVPNEFGDRIAVHVVGDGTSVVCVLSAAHLDLVDQPGLQAIADQVDATPSMSDPSTWLPVK